MSVPKADRLATNFFLLTLLTITLTDYLLASTDPPGFFTHFLLFILLTCDSNSIFPFKSQWPKYSDLQMLQIRLHDQYFNLQGYSK